ncbi:MAG TPA: hypothetical protein VFK44_06890 [Bacillales bacterium]|nr:hypothetical protein [Bacillales bacterium]
MASCFRLCLISVWRWIDPIYFACTRLSYLAQDDGDPVFRVRLAKYKGPDRTLTDGVKIRRNDLLVKIHLHNAKLLRELCANGNDLMKGRLLYQRILQAMPYLASHVSRHKKSDKIKGIIGVTLLSRSSDRLGFDSFPIQSRAYLAMKSLTCYPIFWLSTRRPFKRKHRKLVPKYLFMSKETLLNMYTPESR